MKTIVWSNEHITINVVDIEDKERGCNVKGSTVRMLKYIYRYGGFDTTKAEMANVLCMALKGCNCEDDHLDISQRLSLYRYLKDKEIDDPYIKQFLKQTEEKCKTGILKC